MGQDLGAKLPDAGNPRIRPDEIQRRRAAVLVSSAGAHFPKFVLHRSTRFHELRKVMGTSKTIDSSATFLFEVHGSNSPLVVQELQIGGTSK